MPEANLQQQRMIKLARENLFPPNWPRVPIKAATVSFKLKAAVLFQELVCIEELVVLFACTYLTSKLRDAFSARERLM